MDPYYPRLKESSLCLLRLIRNHYKRTPPHLQALKMTPQPLPKPLPHLPPKKNNPINYPRIPAILKPYRNTSNPPLLLSPHKAKTCKNHHETLLIEASALELLQFLLIAAVGLLMQVVEMLLALRRSHGDDVLLTGCEEGGREGEWKLRSLLSKRLQKCP